MKAAEALYYIAINELEENEKIEAEKLIESVFPKAASELYHIGNNYYKENQYIEAREAFEKVILYGVGSRLVGEALYYIGQIEERNGNLAQAKTYYEKVINGYEEQWSYYQAEKRLKELNK